MEATQGHVKESLLGGELGTKMKEATKLSPLLKLLGTIFISLIVGWLCILTVVRENDDAISEQDLRDQVVELVDKAIQPKEKQQDFGDFQWWKNELLKRGETSGINSSQLAEYLSSHSHLASLQDHPRSDLRNRRNLENQNKLEKCISCGCHDTVCEAMMLSTCSMNPECSIKLQKCLQSCKSESHISSTPTDSRKEISDELISDVVTEEIDKLDQTNEGKLKKILIRTSPLRPFPLDHQEIHNFKLLESCMKYTPHEFILTGSHSPQHLTRCQNQFKNEQFSNILVQGRCRIEWISLYNRAEFLENCVKNQDIEKLFRNSRRQMRDIGTIAESIQKYAQDFSALKTAGGVQLTAGGILLGLGIVIPPLASIGSVLSLTGTGTSLAAELLGEKWTKDRVKDAKRAMKEVTEDYEKTGKLMALYLKSVKQVEFSAGGPQIHNLEKDVNTILANRVPGAIAGAKYLTELSQRIIGKIAGKMFGEKVKMAKKGAIAKVTKLKPKSFGFVKDLGKLTKGLNKFKTSLKTFVSRSGNLALAPLTAYAGIMDIIEGQNLENVHKGLLHEVRAARRDVEYEVDHVIDTYFELDMNTTGGREDFKLRSDISTVKFVTKKTSWWSNLLQLQFESSDGKTCTTQTLEGSYKKWTETFDTVDLGDCYGGDFLIHNYTAKVRILESTRDITIVNVEIATNGRLLPSMICEGSLIAFGSKASDWLDCRRKVGMKKIKTHTSNANYAGTDNSLYFHFEIDRSDGEQVKCSTGKQISTHGKWAGQTHEYNPEGKSFGSCTDDDLAYALIDRDMNKEGDNIRVTVESVNNYLWSDRWEADLIKAYFTTTKKDNLVITCSLCNANIDDTNNGACANGWGGKGAYVWSKTTFNCGVYQPESPERSLESFRVKPCDVWLAGSDSKSLKLQICKKGQSEDWNKLISHYERLKGNAPCCTTNLFGQDLHRNKWSGMFDGNFDSNDGGHVLGQCEGFRIDGTGMEVKLYNYRADAVCLDGFEFYGQSLIGVTSSSNIPFLKYGKAPCKLWGDSEVSQCEGESRWVNWQDKYTSLAIDKDKTDVKDIAIRVCDGISSGSRSTFSAVIQNNDGDQCKTDTFQSLTPGKYIKITRMGDCSNLKINKNTAKVWILNEGAKDSLCLQDVYLDISNPRGETKMLKCRLNEEADYQVHVINQEKFGIPLICK